MGQHEVSRQLDYIQRLLAQNKKPIGFFLGAGCPLSILIKKNPDDEIPSVPLIPDIRMLTQAVGDSLTDDPTIVDKWGDLKKLFKEDGIENPTIEDFLTKVRALKFVAGNGRVRGFNQAELIELDTEICLCISQQVNKELPADTNSPYHDLAIWCRSIDRDFPVSIFTTNYDVLIEQALEESSTPYFDGFIGSKKAFFDLGAVEDDNLLPPRWVRLWKIHGSINWQYDCKHAIIRTSTENMAADHLIFPSHLKYDQSRKMPYLAMLDRLQNFILKKSSALLICGYSFGDDHINEVITRCLQNNPTAIAFGLMYGEITTENSYVNAKKCAYSTTNLSLLGSDGAIIGRRLAPWNFDDTKDIPNSGTISYSGDTNYKTLDIGNFKVFTQMISHISELTHHDEQI